MTEEKKRKLITPQADEAPKKRRIESTHRHAETKSERAAGKAGRESWQKQKPNLTSCERF